jgi:hypothetical protein
MVRIFMASPYYFRWNQKKKLDKFNYKQGNVKGDLTKIL